MRFLRRCLGSTETLPLPRGAGIAAAIAFVLASVAYGTVRGGHVPVVMAELRDFRDSVANLAGFRITSIALAGQRRLTREDILDTAGITGRSSLLFLDAAEARARLKANPWIAEATVLKLYPGRLHIAITERDAFALWQRDGKVEVIADDGTVVEPYARPAFRQAAAGRGRRRRDPGQGFPGAARQVSRDPRPAAMPPSSSPSGAGTSCSRTASTCACRKPSVEQALDTLVKLDRDNKILEPRHRRDRSAPAGPRHRAAVGRGRSGPCGGAQGQEPEEKGRRRMSLRDGLTPKMKPVSPRRSAIVAALDIGTSKIVCLIARLKPQGPQDALRRRSHGIEILGIGHTEARGMKAGAVINLAEAEQAVRHAVDLAERDASVQLESVVLSVSAGRPASEFYAVNVNVAGSGVTDGDIARALAAGCNHSVRAGRVVLHSLPIGYALDGVRGVGEPRGMLAREFGVDMHVVTADVAAARNLMLVVERCHLEVETMVAAPYVAGLSAIADDEADIGAALIDMGAGTTTMAVFSAGRFIHADGFALGGHHVTMDLARGLNARISDAERIKTFYGSVLAGGSDERDMITVPPVGDDDREPPQFVSRASLVRIIKPRVEEILEMVRDRLAASPFASEPRARAILTGGASQLTGLPELAARILNRPVRIGRPLGMAGLPEAAKGPAFAVAAGLLVYPQAAHLEHFEPRRTRHLMTGTGYIARVGRWLRESF